MSPETGRLPTLLKKLALSASVFVIGLVLAEIGFRTWLAASGRGSFDSVAMAERFSRAASPLRPFAPAVGGHLPNNSDGSPVAILHPYAGAEYHHDTGGVLAHFRQGVPADEYSVMVVGGSVATLFANGARVELEGLLARDPRLAGRKVRVLDYAHPAYKQPQQVMRLAYLLSLGYRPDAVINIDGFNEVALAFENGHGGIHPLYPTFPIWGFLVQDFGAPDPALLDLTLDLWQLRGEARALADRAKHWRLYKSSLASYAVLHRLTAILDRRNEVQDAINARANQVVRGSSHFRQMNGPDFDTKQGPIFDVCLNNWFESSVSLHALCESRGIAYLHVLQPTLNDPDSKPLTDEEKALPPGAETWRLSVVYGYPLLRERSKELVKSGVTFLDASRVFADTHETLYFDACHFNDAGDRILARFIAPYFLEHVLPQSVVGGTVHLSDSTSATGNR